MGTAGLRIAPNSADFVAAVQDRSGLLLEIISGEHEGHLAYLAAMAGIGQVSGSRVVFDTGGGSSQFTFGSGDQVEERFSVNVGSISIITISTALIRAWAISRRLLCTSVATGTKK